MLPFVPDENRQALKKLLEKMNRRKNDEKFEKI
jgi:hypothetical protein